MIVYLVPLDGHVRLPYSLALSENLKLPFCVSVFSFIQEKNSNYVVASKPKQKQP